MRLLCMPCFSVRLKARSAGVTADVRWTRCVVIEPQASQVQGAAGCPLHPLNCLPCSQPSPAARRTTCKPA